MSYVKNTLKLHKGDTIKCSNSEYIGIYRNLLLNHYGFDNMKIRGAQTWLFTITDEPGQHMKKLFTTPKTDHSRDHSVR